MVVVGDLVQLKKVFLSQGIKLFPLGVEIQNLCKGQANKMKIPIFGFDFKLLKANFCFS